MKTIIMLLLLASCGNNKGLNARLDGVEAKNREQDERLSALELQTNTLILSITDLTQELEIIQENEESSTENISSVIQALQTQVNANIIQIAALDLETSNSITQIVDPCGNGAGYDEVILKTKAGEYLAYFEHGSQRYLTKLEIGNYMTTDGTGCHFSLTSTGLIW